MLTSTLPRWDGDSEPRFVLDLAKHMGKDFEVEIIAPNAPGAARSEVLEGVPVTRFRYWIPRWQSVAYEGGITWRLKENPLRLVQLPYFLWSLAWHVVRRLRSEPPIDLVHAHWIIPQGLVAVLVRGLARRRVPVVCTSHGGDLFGLRGRGWRMLKREVLRDCDAVTVVSQAMAEAATELVGGVNPVVIPMGTDLTYRFVPQITPRPTSISNLVFVGRLVEKKGVKYLLESMAALVKQRSDICLKIIGHGPLRVELEADAQRLGLRQNVKFLGPIPHDQLPAHYQTADIAVFPFVEAASGDQEGFGLVMVEAMGCGCTVVASELPAVRDVVKHGRTGLLVEPGDVKALTRAIESLLAAPTTARTIAQNARAYAIANFDWAVCAKKFREVYDRIMDSRAVSDLDPTSPSPSTSRGDAIDVSRRGHAVIDLVSRHAKARKIEGLLNPDSKGGVLKVLEIGTGSGGIASYFANHPKLRCEVDAVDVSDTRQGRDGYRFTLVEGVELPFPDREYDIVISNHVIEHVGDHEAQRQHLSEMHRLLKPHGLGYLAVPNRWQLVEPHYRLAFLSWLPPKWRSPYVRLRGRGPDYDCRPLTVLQLEPLLAEAGFHYQQEHCRALKLTFELERPNALVYRMMLKHVPTGIYQLIRRAFPTLIYLLKPIPEPLR